MKKTLTLLFITLFLFSFSGCGRNPENAGTYIASQKQGPYDYAIELNPDGTGRMLTTDLIDITWNGTNINQGTSAYGYTLKGDVLTFQGMEYIRSDKSINDLLAYYILPGTYLHTYTEEMEGEELTFTDSICLNDDGTGTLELQDQVPITWNGKELLLQDGTSYPYTPDIYYLSITVSGITEEPIQFTKEGIDPALLQQAN